MLIISHTVTTPLARAAAPPGAPGGPGAGDMEGDPSGPVSVVAARLPGGLPATVAGPHATGPGEPDGGTTVEGAWGRGRPLERATRLLNRLLEESRRRLKFNVHEDTGRIWVQVIDLETNEVVKEIPPERYLDLVARIWELVGLLVDEHA